MENDAPQDRVNLEEELRRLDLALRRMESRVVCLEGAVLPGARAAPGPSAARAEPSSPDLSSLHFSRLALACFILGGSLILRTVTQERWISPGLGYASGLAYCGALLLGPWLATRVHGRWVHGRLLQICGALLAPLIVLEAVHREAVGIPGATLILGGVSLGVSLLGILESSPGLSGTALLAPMLATAGLGLTPTGVAWRAGLVLALAALGQALAALPSWSFLRPLTVVPAGLLLGIGVILTAVRPEIPTHAPAALVLCLLGLLGLVAVSYFGRMSLLDRFERACLPVLALWIYGMCALYAPRAALGAAAGCALTLLGVVASLSPRGEPAKRATTGLLTTSSLLLVLSLPWLEASGLALGALALLVQRLGQARANRAGVIGAQVMALAAAATALLGGGVITLDESALLARVLAGWGLGLVLLLHYAVAIRREHAHMASGLLAPLSLAGAVTTIFFSLRLAAWHVFPPAHAFGLAQTVGLALLSVTVLAVGRKAALRAAVLLGFGGIALLGTKVLLWDIRHLEGAYLVSSVLVLGLAALAASLTLRQRSSPG